MKINIRTTNGQKQAEIYEGWAQTPYHIAKRLILEGEANAKALSIMTGLEFDVINKSMNVMDVMALLQHVGWINQSPFELRFARPDTVEIDGQKLKLKDDLGEMTWAFHLDTEAATKEIDPAKPETMLNAYEEIVAGYLQELRDGEYELKKAIELRPKIFNLTFGTVAGIAGFFLRKKAGYMIGALLTQNPSA